MIDFEELGAIEDFTAVSVLGFSLPRNKPWTKM